MIPHFGRVPELALDWFFMATEACSGRTSYLGLHTEVFEYLMIYRVKRLCGRPPRGEPATWARLAPLAHTGDWCPPRAASLVLLQLILALLLHKKYPKCFAAFGLCLVLTFGDVKNKHKTATGTGHYVNRLVPKNAIKFL